MFCDFQTNTTKHRQHKVYRTSEDKLKSFAKPTRNICDLIEMFLLRYCPGTLVVKLVKEEKEKKNPI